MSKFKLIPGLPNQDLNIFDGSEHFGKFCRVSKPVQTHRDVIRCESCFERHWFVRIFFAFDIADLLVQSDNVEDSGRL